MSDSLTYVDKCFIAAIASMNASYLSREGSVRPAYNAAIETMQIKTLAEYYKGDPEKLKTYDPTKMDNDKLMRTYVIPLILDNSEPIDLIVNSKGQDMACVYLDEDSKTSQFQLTPRMKAEIEQAVKENGINGLETKMSIDKIQEMVKPESLDEFTEAVADDNLVPKNSRDTIARVKSRDENAEIQMADDEVFEIEDEENKTPAEVQEEISLEENRLKTIAEKAGMSLEDMKRFCKDNKLTSKSVKGAIEVINVDELEQWLDGRQLNGNGESSVVIIRTQENGLQNRARIASREGKTILDNSKYDDRIAPLVPEYETSEPIRDLKEHEDETNRLEEVEYTGTDGKEKTALVQGDEVDAQIFEEKFNKIQAEYKTKLEQIDNSDMAPEEKTQAKESIAADFYADVRGLERETGVVANEITSEALANAEAAVVENTKTQLKEDAKDALAIAGTVATATVGAAAVVGAAELATSATIAKVVASTGAKLIKNDKEKDTKEEDKYGDYIEHYGKNLENPHERKR